MGGWEEGRWSWAVGHELQDRAISIIAENYEMCRCDTVIGVNAHCLCDGAICLRINEARSTSNFRACDSLPVIQCLSKACRHPKGLSTRYSHDPISPTMV